MMSGNPQACPTCGSAATRKDGYDERGGQRFRCGACRCRFTATTGTPFSGYRFPPDVIALAVRWYLRFRLRYADVAELLAERGVRVDPSNVYAWVQGFAPRYEAAARAFRRAVGERWSVDERYINVADAEQPDQELRPDPGPQARAQPTREALRPRARGRGAEARHQAPGEALIDGEEEGEDEDQQPGHEQGMPGGPATVIPLRGRPPVTWGHVGVRGERRHGPSAGAVRVGLVAAWRAAEFAEGADPQADAPLLARLPRRAQLHRPRMLRRGDHVQAREGPERRHIVHRGVPRADDLEHLPARPGHREFVGDHLSRRGQQLLRAGEPVPSVYTTGVRLTTTIPAADMHVPSRYAPGTAPAAPGATPSNAGPGCCRGGRRPPGCCP